jgi:hypothetical protein
VSGSARVLREIYVRASDDPSEILARVKLRGEIPRRNFTEDEEMKNTPDAETKEPTADQPRVLDEDAVEAISGGSLRTEDRQSNNDKVKEEIDVESWSYGESNMGGY